MVERRQSMILQFFRKTCNTLDEQSNWNKHCAELQTIINSTKSATREHLPFFLTFFQNSNYPLTGISSIPINYNEESTVASKLTLPKRLQKTSKPLQRNLFKNTSNNLIRTFRTDDAPYMSTPLRGERPTENCSVLIRDLISVSL